MSTTTTTGEHKSEESVRMGVASLSSNKRRLENADVGDEDYVAPKVLKKAAEFVESAAEVQDTIIGIENSSDFLTTSILARTLLTSTSVSQCSPLECLSSTLEALPAPMLDGADEIRSTFLPFKTTIHEATELEFTSLLCHERPLSTVTVLSPIDEESGWSSSTSSSGKTTKSCNSSCLSPVSDQVITEDETGKSYFNLGSADTTLLVKKSPSPVSANNNNVASNNTTTPPTNTNNANNSPSNMPVLPGGGGDQTWTNCNNSDFQDDGSSSSCESISSEDLFTSEEFDASEDEEEIRSYKQQRSTVLHLSLCKLNSFRTQQCVEPSLHRSVLICNTLRHIEQEIRSEDEIPVRSHQPLPPFWGSPQPPPPQQNPNNSSNNNNNNSSNHAGPAGNAPVNQQPQITDVRPNPPPPHVASLHGHDPYLSPNSYSNSIDSPYNITYDYNSLRPNPTPFHTASYDYEQDLPLVNGSPSTAQILDVSSPPSLLECDSGYAEDLNLSNYYYNTSTPTRNGLGSHSLTSCDQNGSSSPSVNGGPDPSYINCGYNSLALTDASVGVASSTPTTCNGNEPILSDSSLLTPSSDMSDIDMHNSLSLPQSVERTPSCDYLLASSSNNNNNNSSSTNNNNNNNSSSSSSSESSSENSISPPPSLSDGSSNNSSATSNNSSLCWSKLSLPVSLGMNGCSKQADIAPLTNSTNNAHPTFVQQESHQCGMESRLSEFSRSHSNFSNPHHHNLPMDSLISSNYSNTL